MKPLIFLAAIFLVACSKQNQGIHARLVITAPSNNTPFPLYTLNPNGSTDSYGPISTLTLKLYQIDGTMDQIGPMPWDATPKNEWGDSPGYHNRAVLIIADNMGHTDSTEVDQNF